MGRKVTEPYSGTWHVLEADDGVHIIPASDIEPHSKETEGNKRVLAGLDCPCKPEIITGDEEGMFDSPIIHHKSFQDKAYLDAVMSGEIQEKVAKV